MRPALNKLIAALIAVPLAFTGCTRGVSSMPNQQGDKMIDETAARAIAQQDAVQVYRDLSIYRVKAELKAGNWHVDYELEGDAVAGGGPHYIISGKTGEILKRR